MYQICMVCMKPKSDLPHLMLQEFQRVNLDNFFSMKVGKVYSSKAYGEFSNGFQL